MKCAHCGNIFNTQPVCGICCSAECSRLFGESLTPQPEPREQPDPMQLFIDFAAQFGVDVVAIMRRN